MKNKKLLSVLICALTALCCLVVVSCSGKTDVDKAAANGYTLTVKFDLGGGIIGGDENVSLMDMYRPEDYTADENGDVHINLYDPTYGERPNIGYNASTNPYPLTNLGHLLIGWYSERTQTESGEYEYSGRWDFSSDKVTMKRVGEKKEVTLYAAWTEFFEFDFYALGENGATTLIETKTLDYIPSRVAGTPNEEKTGVYLPYVEDGATVYETSYASSGSFEFPKIEGKTFKAAYADKEKTQPITTSKGSPWKHNGSVDEQKGVAENRVQDIFIEYEDGVYYDISTADQLIKYADNNDYSVYRINADLDFTDKTWPSAFANGWFTGKMYSSDGNHTIKNVKASVQVTGASSGLFAEVAEGAIIKDIVFEDLTVDFASGTFTNDTKCGLFSGNISENATVDVTISSATVKVGFVMQSRDTEDYEFNLIACGDKSGIKCDVDNIKLFIYCDLDLYDAVKEINFSIDPMDVIKSSDDKVVFKFLESLAEQSKYQNNGETEYEIKI